MLPDARKLLPFLLAPLLTHCGSNSAPPTNTVTGPFDSRGNYIEEWVNDPDKWYRPSDPEKNSKSKKIAKKEKKEQPPQIAVVEPKPAPDPVVVTPKPAPKPQPKPKPKPKYVMHKVKKGDTLSGLSRRYGSSISKIKSANGISGTIIRLGQTLKIPK